MSYLSLSVMNRDPALNPFGGRSTRVSFYLITWASRRSIAASQSLSTTDPRPSKYFPAQCYLKRGCFLLKYFENQKKSPLSELSQCCCCTHIVLQLGKISWFQVWAAVPMLSSSLHRSSSCFFLLWASFNSVERRGLNAKTRGKQNGDVRKRRG